MKGSLRSQKLSVLAAAFLLLVGSTSAFAESWKFGVISDAQWTIKDDGRNPNTSAADIIKQVDQQFIAAGVKLVVHVGDMVDTGSQKNDYARALYAQDLYNAGIGFYPLRGNHEAANGSYTGSSADFVYTYPQIVPGSYAGINNSTPGDVYAIAAIPAVDLTNNPPDAKSNLNTFKVGENFSAPDSANTSTGGVSYAFDYKNATFMLLDQFKSPDYYTSHIPEQQSWIDATLSGRSTNTHAFVFTHKNILGGNHKDNMFGGNATNDPGDGWGLSPDTSIANTPGLTVGMKQGYENTFLASLQKNRVKYVISGHDHHHYNSVVTSPDGSSKVHQLITQSDSSKFYTPGTPVSPNDAPIEQDLARIGFYIFTVDGPRVTIDYWADDHGNWLSSGTTPSLHFVKRSTTGYSLNGIEEIVSQSTPYVMADDTTLAETMEPGFLGTMMAINGINESGVTTNYGKATSKDVNTGWAPSQNGLASDILTLWGMEDLGRHETDTYVLSLSFDPQPSREHLGNGGFGIAAKDIAGNWVNAVETNTGGDVNFVKGPWKPGYRLGTYGVYASTKTAWAVINHGGEFAVSTDIEPVPGKRDR